METNRQLGLSEPGRARFDSLRRRSGASPQSIETYADAIGSLRPMAGKPLNEMTEVEALDETLLARGKVYRNILRMWYRAHRKHDLLDALPRQSRKVRRKSLDDILSPRDVMSLIAAANNKRDRALIAVLAATGARISEIVDLKVKHVLGGTEGYQFFIGKKIRGRERYSPKVEGEYKRVLDKWLAAIPDRQPESWLFPSMKT